MIESGGRFGLLLTGFATGGITALYYTIGGFIGWFPFGSYPGYGSPQAFAVYIFALLVAVAISLLAFRGLHRTPSQAQVYAQH